MLNVGKFGGVGGAVGRGRGGKCGYVGVETQQDEEELVERKQFRGLSVVLEV